MTLIDPDNEATFHVCVIKSDPHQTDLPKRAIIDELKRWRFGPEATFAVKLALEEALANAVKHGNECNLAKEVVVRYAVSAEKVTIVIRDEGCGFRPEAVPDPTTPERLPLPEGRGIMLMRAYMDEVTYRDQGREVYMVKRKT